MLAEFLGELIFKPILEVVFYGSGKLLVHAMSLGRLQVAMVEPDRRAKDKRRWYSITFVRNGRRFLDAEVAMLVGVLFWAVVIFGIVMVIRIGRQVAAEG